MSLLERLQKESPKELAKRSYDSMNWFRKRVQRLRIPARRFYQTSGIEKTDRYIDGKMYMYFYDAKTQEKLPYWDRFPCVIVIEDYRDGSFLGINLHYIPPRYRIRLLDGLFEYTNNEKFDETTRIRMTYQLLTSVAKLKWAKPCIKKYLKSNIVGNALNVDPEYWDLIALLPVTQFQKENANKVYAYAKKEIYG